MLPREIHRAALTSIIAVAITLGPGLDAGQGGAPSVQYRSPQGVSEAELRRLAPGADRINPMIVLHERGLPIFGITHPPIVAGRGSAPLPSLLDAARETMAYRFSDFAYDNYSSAAADRFRGYMEAMLAAGGSARAHAFMSKVPIIHTDPAHA